MTSAVIQPSRTIQITGIAVHLAKSLEHSLLIELSVDDTNSGSLLLKRKERPVGSHSLQKPLNLLEGSTLAIRIQENHRLRRNETLAHLNLSSKAIWLGQDTGAIDSHVKKCQIQLKDPTKKIWLNFDVLPSPNDNVDQDSCAPARATEPLKAASDATIQKLREFKTALDHLGGARYPVEIALKFGTAMSELNPIAKGIVGCVNVIYGQIKVQDQGHKEILALVENMARTVNHIQPVRNIAELNELRKTLEMFPDLMQETANLVEDWVNQSVLGNIGFALSNTEKINDLKNRYNVFEREFDRGIKIDEAVKTHSLTKSQDLKVLADWLLGGIKMIGPRAIECIPGTRTAILAEVDIKTDNHDDPNIIWIRGAPGSGKSSISLSAKSRLRSQGRLLTYFRFDRSETTTTTPTALWRRVAYDLARRLPSVRTRFLQHLRDDSVDLDSPIAAFTSLVEASLLELTEVPLDYPLVIVIDAVDECGGFIGRSSPDRKALMQTLGSWAKLPRHFKLLVTSREESDITRALSHISASVHIPSGKFLTDNPQAQGSISASKDIHTFLEDHFLQIRESLSTLPPNWPGEATIAQMVSRAAGNFMWATTALNFIDSGLDPQDQLQTIMTDFPEPTSMEPLYSLYSTILKTSFGNFAPNSPKAETLRAVLGTIIFARRPFRDIEYTKLPTTTTVNATMVELIRDRLRSVVDHGPTLRFVHKSFDDFLLSDKCPTEYAIRMDESQCLLTKLCLTTMTAELHFDMCKLETSCLKNTDIPNIETRVADSIPALLSYSCCFWADHLSRTPFDEHVLGIVKEMVLDKLLYWFEAMSFLKEAYQVAHSLFLVLEWSNAASDEEFKYFLRDARQLIRTFIHPIAQSAPHIYLSALPFAPERSSVARHFLPRFPHILTVSTGKPVNWSSCNFTTEYHQNPLNLVVFSPDEKHFASVSSEAICICDSETGSLISRIPSPFTSRSDSTPSIFDPDGRHVWAYYPELGQVISWDVETGDQQLNFTTAPTWGAIGRCFFQGGWHIVSASSKALLWSAETGHLLQELFEIHDYDEDYPPYLLFSPDGRFMAGVGINELTIRIWRMQDGSEIRGLPHSQPRLGHTERISVLSFSVDGHFLLSGSDDGSIIIWDVNTGDIVGHPLVTGKGRVYAVAYSHKDRLLVSASGMPGVVIVWNTTNHEAVLGPLEGHTYQITDIALSRDAQRVLSSSRDGTVRMWDLTRKAVAPVSCDTECHTGWILCATFSPCGKKLASLLDDQTIRIWDTNTGRLILSPIRTLSTYSCIIFSPDGSQIVGFGSNFDGIVRAWDVDTGELAFDQDLSDDNQEYTYIDHLAFRSTDQRLVTCSNHGVVRIWSLEAGSMTKYHHRSSIPPPVDANKPIEIIALSPDGMTAILFDDNRHRMWNTTSCQPLPFAISDSEHITKFDIAYSPNGKYVAYTHFESKVTLRIWNTQTGELAAGPSTFEDGVHCLAVPPNNDFLTISLIRGLWICNARTGCPISGPWNGHTDSITTLAFSPDGEKLVSGSTDGQMRIWNTAHLLKYSKASVGLLEGGTHMEDGWVMDASGKLLFWVPMEHRVGLVWPGNVAVIGIKSVLTQLHLERFRYGEHWVECYRKGK